MGKRDLNPNFVGGKSEVSDRRDRREGGEHRDRRDDRGGRGGGGGDRRGGGDRGGGRGQVAAVVVEETGEDNANTATSLELRAVSEEKK